MFQNETDLDPFSPDTFIYLVDSLFYDIGPLTWLLLLLTIASTAGLLYLLARVLRRTFPGLTSCGQCGYAVQGLTAMSCPECGADFRQVGMVSPRQRRAVSIPAFLLFWTLCFPLPAIALMRTLIAIGPADRTPYAYGSVSVREPAGFSFVSFQMDSAGPVNAANGPPEQTMSLDFADAQRQTIGAAEVDYRDRTIKSASYLDGGSSWIEITDSQPAQLNRASLLAIFQSMKLNIANPALAEQADELLHIIDLTPAGKLNGATLLHFTIDDITNEAFTEPKPWFVTAVILAGPILWLAGILAFILLTRARNRAARLRCQPTPINNPPAATAQSPA